MMATQPAIQAANRRPGSASHSGTVRTIMASSVMVNASWRERSLAWIHVHLSPARPVMLHRRPRESSGVIAHILRISSRSSPWADCWESGIVPQAPSMSGGTYVTGHC